VVIQAVRHIGITVSNMRKSVEFYRDYLGLRIAAVFPQCEGEYISSLVGVPNALIDITHLEAPDGSRIELLEYLSHPTAAGSLASANEPGRPHCAFTVLDLQDLYERRLQFNCEFKHPPQQSPDGVLVAYCHDPDGTILELVQPISLS
jgi:catechol 2,3-dioxygenase-like lactoylglutathione lyase family enzyme